MGQFLGRVNSCMYLSCQPDSQYPNPQNQAEDNQSIPPSYHNQHHHLLFKSLESVAKYTAISVDTRLRLERDSQLPHVHLH
jgi:hypothetical protein